MLERISLFTDQKVEKMLANPTATGKYQRISALFETILIFLGLLSLWFLLPHTIAADGASRLQDLSLLLQKGIIYQPHSRYSLVGPIFAAPLWFLGELFGTPRDWVCMYNTCLFILALLFMYILLKDHLEHALLRRFFLLLITASMFAAHLTNFYGEVFTAFSVGIGLMSICIGSTSILGWSAVILGVVNTPAAIVGLILLVCKRVIDSKRLRYVLSVVCTGVLLLLEALLRHHNIFNTGYDADAGFKTVMPYSGLAGFSYPFFFGLLSILFSFGKGIFFFAPGLLLPVRTTLLRLQSEQKLAFYRLYLLWICFLVGLILVYSRWWAWYGGLFWGPRFFLFASIPATFALALRLYYRNVSLRLNLFTLVVYCLSAWVGLDGALWSIPLTDLRTCTQKQYALEMLCHYTPEFSVLWRPFVVFPGLDQDQIIFGLYCLLVFLYLLVPLLLTIFYQCRARLQQQRPLALHLRGWRF